MGGLGVPSNRGPKRKEDEVCTRACTCSLGQPARHMYEQRTCASMKSNSAGRGSLMRKRRWKRAPFGSLIKHAVVADSPAGGSGGSEAPFSCDAFPQSMQGDVEAKFV